MISNLLTRVKVLALQVLKKRSFYRLIGIGLFILVLFRIDLNMAWQTLKTVDLRFVILSLLLQMMGLLVATVRWQLIMHQLAIYLPFPRTLIHQLIGTGAALITPGQLGEFVKVLYHRQEGVPVAESLFSVIIDRVYDLLMLLLLGFIAMAVLVGVSPLLTVIMAAGGATAFIVAFFLTRHNEKSGRLVARWLTKLTPRAYKETMQADALRLTRRVGDFGVGFLSIAGLLTVVNYLLLLFRMYFLLLALHLEVPLWYFALVVPLVRLVGFIPVSVSGIGTRDVTVIYLLSRVGIPQEASLVFSLLRLFALQFQALVGLVVWWRHPLKLKKKEKPPAPEEAQPVASGQQIIP